MPDTSTASPHFNDLTGRWTLAPHITKASDGYVFWRDSVRVEHFTFSESRREAELQSAARLSKRCLHLEAIGIPVNWNTVLRECCYTAPAESRWLQVLPRIYALFKEGNAVAGVFWTTACRTVTLIKYPGEHATRSLEVYESGAEASDALQNLGFHTHPAVGYDAVATTLHAFELPAVELEALIA